jgi:hypothetical protein
VIGEKITSLKYSHEDRFHGVAEGAQLKETGKDHKQKFVQFK